MAIDCQLQTATQHEVELLSRVAVLWGRALLFRMDCNEKGLNRRLAETGRQVFVVIAVAPRNHGPAPLAGDRKETGMGVATGQNGRGFDTVEAGRLGNQGNRRLAGALFQRRIAVGL